MRELTRLGKEGWHGRVLADRFWPVWTQMFFSARPWDWAVGGTCQERDGRRRPGAQDRLDLESGSQFACPQCGKFCPLHDTVDKKWRHLDFWQHRTEFIARVPRTNCQEHGILQAAVPWARPGSGFTLMMEAMILLLGQQMSVSAAARRLGESDKRLWRVLEHYVMEAHAAKDWSQVRRLMIDETSARKGHRYVTVVLDAESHALLLMVEGRMHRPLPSSLQPCLPTDQGRSDYRGGHGHEPGLHRWSPSPLSQRPHRLRSLPYHEAGWGGP